MGVFLPVIGAGLIAQYRAEVDAEKFIAVRKKPPPFPGIFSEDFGFMFGRNSPGKIFGLNIKILLVERQFLAFQGSKPVLLTGKLLQLFGNITARQGFDEVVIFDDAPLAEAAQVVIDVAVEGFVNDLGVGIGKQEN